MNMMQLYFQMSLSLLLSLNYCYAQKRVSNLQYLECINPTDYTVNRRNVKKIRRNVNAKTKIKRTILNKTANSIRSKTPSDRSNEVLSNKAK